MSQLKLFKMAQKMHEKRLLKKSPLSRPRYKIQTLSAAVQKVVLVQPSFPAFRYKTDYNGNDVLDVLDVYTYTPRQL